MSWADKFNLLNPIVDLRLICALFFVPHIVGKFTEPATLGFFVAAKFNPPATWMYIAGTIETFLTLGLVFTLGMVVTDALNGLWVSRLVARADARAAGASRAMSLAIALLSLAIAATGAARHAMPGLDERLGEWSFALGVVITACVALAYRTAMRGTPRAAARSA